MNDFIKIILVDDHLLVRDGIKQLLIKESNILIIGEASDYNELMRILSNDLPDIILMDISLPDKNGIEITNEITLKYPEISVIILSMHNDEEFILNSLKSGAKGYLPKNTNKQELIEAINKVYNGENFLNSSISHIALKSFFKLNKNEKDYKDLSILSKREIELLKLFAEGFTNKEIADKLFISIRTVESHKNHIMQKLDLKHPVELIKFALKNKIANL